MKWYERVLAATDEIDNFIRAVERGKIQPERGVWSGLKKRSN